MVDSESLSGRDSQLDESKKETTGGLEAGLGASSPGESVNEHTVTWDGDYDPENPKNWPARKKNMVVATVCLHGLCVAMSSTLIAPAVFVVRAKFDVSAEVGVLALSLCILGWATGPLVFSPMSEIYGRNFVYRVTWIPFVLFSVGTALSKNIQTLLVLRFFVGVFGSPVTTLATAQAYDMFDDNEVGPIGFLMCLFSFLGPSLGELCGGFLVQYESWRWTLWLSVIFSGALALNGLWYPETHAHTILNRKAKQLRKSTGDPSYQSHFDTHKLPKLQIFSYAIWRPLQLLALEPIVLFTSLLVAVVWGILYLYLGAYTLVLTQAYGWEEGKVGGAFSGIGIGVLLSAFAAKFANVVYIKLRDKHGGSYPEGRLPPAMVCAVILPGTIFWYAWSAKPEVHWIVPVLSGVPFGLCMVVLFITFVTYTADCFPNFTASATAANALLRYLFAAGFPIFAPKMYTNLDPDWATSILAFITVAFMPVPFIFYKFGPTIRRHSRFKPKYA